MTSRRDTMQVPESLDGDAAAMLPLVYDELRRLAGHYFREEPGARTLQPTALVHEVYLRLLGDGRARFSSRAQLLSLAARAMRRLLIDHARRRGAARRGGGRRPVPLDGIPEPAADRDGHLLALDEALSELGALDPDLVRVVELRFFGGLSVEESAAVLACSPATVKRRWRLARGWLHRRISEDGRP